MLAHLSACVPGCWCCSPYPICRGALAHHPAAGCAVLANFYAPWCPWCQRLEPTWEAVQQKVHDKYPDADGRIRMGKVRLQAAQLATGRPSALALLLEAGHPWASHACCQWLWRPFDCLGSY